MPTVGAGTARDTPGSPPKHIDVYADLVASSSASLEDAVRWIALTDATGQVESIARTGEDQCAD